VAKPPIVVGTVNIHIHVWIHATTLSHHAKLKAHQQALHPGPATKKLLIAFKFNHWISVIIKCIHDSVCVLPYAQAHDIHAHVLLLCDWQTMSKYVFWKYCVQTLVLQTLELWLLISNATCLDCRYYHQTVDAGPAYPQWPHIRNTAPLNRTCSWCW